ncbi:MAG: TfoX/Sxy family protein [Candidatus Limnocylindria bacterium]
MAKSPPELVERFHATLAAFPEAERRQMFGYPAAFRGGNMFTSLFESRWVIRLPEDARTELADQGGEQFEPMPGRPMTGYLLLPPRIVDDDKALRGWVERALAHAAALPPKEPKKRKR